MLKMKEIREKQNKSQAQVGRDGGMHPSSISMIENGRLKAGKSQMKKIADALGWTGSPEELFEEVEV